MIGGNAERFARNAFGLRGQDPRQHIVNGNRHGAHGLSDEWSRRPDFVDKGSKRGPVGQDLVELPIPTGDPEDVVTAGESGAAIRNWKERKRRNVDDGKRIDLKPEPVVARFQFGLNARGYIARRYRDGGRFKSRFCGKGGTLQTRRITKMGQQIDAERRSTSLISKMII